MNQAITDARDVMEVREINLSVGEQQSAAISLYTSLGFQQWGHQKNAICVDKNFYDELHMTVQL